ncbi:MAG: flagellar basal body rod protein FlgC [Carboxydocellales bacterium]
MSFMQSLDISATALTAQRLRMDIISNNLANVNTTRTEKGGAYRRQMPVFVERPGELSFRQVLQKTLGGQGEQEDLLGRGVRVTEIIEDQTPLKMIYNPDHPDANKDGYVAMPNVNTVMEMVDMISATRAYEASVTAVNSAKGMAMKALEIGRG